MSCQSGLVYYHGIAGSQRYFVLDKGILVYGKSPGDLARGKIHGSVDVGLSVISTKSKRKRLDIDAEEFIHHLKVSETLAAVAVDSCLYSVEVSTSSTQASEFWGLLYGKPY